MEFVSQRTQTGQDSASNPPSSSTRPPARRNSHNNSSGHSRLRSSRDRGQHKQQSVSGGSCRPTPAIDHELPPPHQRGILRDALAHPQRGISPLDLVRGLHALVPGARCSLASFVR
eukprot:4827906-Amphidinium_carterae.1